MSSHSTHPSLLFRIRDSQDRVAWWENEPDHFDFDQPKNNFVAAIGEYASWGFFDLRMKGEGFDHGYQSVPVNWSAMSPRKKGFFRLLSEITGEGRVFPGKTWPRLRIKLTIGGPS